MIDRSPLVLLRMPVRDHALWPAAASWFGGDPRLGPAPWPRADGAPLHFLAQIDLSEASRLRPGAGLPRQGSLAFFVDAKDEPTGRVVFVPDHMAQPTVAPPADTGPVYGEHWHYHRPSAASAEDAPRAFRRWPMRLVPIDLPPDLDAETAALAFGDAISALGATETGLFWQSLRSLLPEDALPTPWLAATLFLGSLRRTRGAIAPAREVRAAALRDGLVHLARLKSDPSGPPDPSTGRRKPPAQSVLSRLMGIKVPPVPPTTRAGQIEKLEAALASRRAEIERLDAMVPVLAGFIREIEAWIGGRDPTEAMTPEEARTLRERSKDARSRFEPVHRGYYWIQELPAQALKDLLVLAPDVVPTEIRELVDRVHLLPSRGRYHLMLGPPANIQHAAEENADKVLLAQFHSDDMLDWMWGDVGVLQFWIDPSDLRRGDWSRVVLTAEGQ